MNPTETDLRLAELSAAVEGGVQLFPEDGRFLLDLVQRLSRPVASSSECAREPRELQGYTRHEVQIVEAGPGADGFGALTLEGLPQLGELPCGPAVLLIPAPHLWRKP